LYGIPSVDATCLHDALLFPIEILVGVLLMRREIAWLFREGLDPGKS